MKFEVFGQAVFVLDSGGGNKGNLNCIWRLGMVHKNVSPSYRRIGLSQEFRVSAVRWKKKRGFGCDRKDIFRKVESFQAAAPYIKG